ncbi:Transglycosylase SLT domain protein [compost metagenome]
MLRASQSLEIARFMNSANAEEDKKSENNRSVWGVNTSPFDDYPLNTDARSIEPFMAVLQQDANQEILNEKVKAGQAAKTQSLVNKALGTNGSNGPVGVMAIDRGNAARSGGSSALLKAMYGSMQTAGGDAGYMNGGLAVEHPGNGTGGSVNDLPKMTGADGQYSSYKDMIVAVSKMVGVDPGLMATMAALESNFQGSVKASTSSASGLYQFIDSTWKAMLAKYGAKYGLDPNTPATDPRANALIGAEYIRENAEKLEKGLGRKPTDTDIYLAHFLGPAGALKFLSSNGSANAATIMPKAANANKSIFFADGRPRTISQVYAEIDRRVKVKRDMYAGDARAAMGMAPGTANTPTPAIPGVTAGAGLGMSAPANDPGTTGSGGGSSAPAMGTGTVGIMAPSGAPTPQGGGSSTGPIGVMAPAANQGPVSASQQALATNPNLSSTESAGNATLQREKSTDGGTFGKLTLPDGTSFNTLELPWRNNESGKSCIPPGTYKVETRNSPKFGPGTYEVKGVPGRNAILIHSGNYAGNVDKGQKSNVEGCILLGFSRSTQSGQPMIQESRAAMKAFTEKMAGRPFVLTVISAEGDTTAPAAAPGQTTPAGGSTGVSPLAQSVGATMPTTTPSSSASTPYVAPVSQSVPGPSYSGGVTSEPSLGAPEATLLRKQQAEREAQAAQLQSQTANAELNQNVGSVTEYLKQQLEVQQKMAESLENIDKNIANLGTAEAAKAQEPAKAETAKPTNSGSRPAEVAVRTTPISMKRMRA